jgi:tRNA pseudouridine38-40 synthase
MFDAGCILEQNHGHFKKIGWGRCARTDKGVHACTNVVHLKMMLEDEDPGMYINIYICVCIRESIH